MLLTIRRSRFSVITQCCIHELYLQGKSEQPAVDLAKTFERRKCNHREAIPGDECLTSVIGMSWHCISKSRSLHRKYAGETNKHRYVLASQSQPLRTNMRTVPAVPIVHVNRSVMILEPPSDATIRAKNAVSARRLVYALSPLSNLCEGGTPSVASFCI